MEAAKGSPPSPVSERASPERASPLPSLWLAGAFLLLLFPLSQWLTIPRGYRLVAAETPLDGTRPDLAAEWRFLVLAHPFVPAGARFTVIARDDGTEMELFMLALGILPECEPVPTTYFKKRHGLGATAEYVLAYGNDEPEGAATLIGRVPGGAVYRRSSRP